MAVLMSPRLHRVRTAAFADEPTLEAAVRSMTSAGYPEDLLGVAIRPGHVFLLSVVAEPGRECETDRQLLSAGALLSIGCDELPPGYGPAPHPGVHEDHDLKLPMGREYPASAWAPAIAGYRVQPPVLDPHTRVWSFDEVAPGYSPAEALAEADRCLRCPEPRCVQGCPAANRIPDFIAALAKGDVPLAAHILRETTNFPGICGRVCDRARQCEGACVLGQEGGDAVAIGLLERFVADQELRSDARIAAAFQRKPASGYRVAVIGSGPSGLAAAEQLATMGHAVTVFEALPVIGGALAWGIPTFRLPQAVLQGETDFLGALGVEFRLNTKVGLKPTVDELLQEGFDAVFFGAGATASVSPDTPGADLEGVYSAMEFLSLAKLARVHGPGQWKAPVVGERIAVIGAGNTAIDVAQTAVRLSHPDLQELSAKQATIDVAETATRLGYREVTVVYRRSEADMPARRDEIQDARDEGVRFRFLTAPVRFLGEGGHLRAMECVEMTLEQRDAASRHAAVPRPGTEFVIEVDTVVLALGYRVGSEALSAIPGIAASASGSIVADPRTGRTARPRVWAGGDVTSGPDTVVRAMVAGRRAAEDIDRYFDGIAAGRKGAWT